MEQKADQQELITDILVFKTSIQTPLEVQFLASILDHENGISSWNVDLDDWERILRIESKGITPEEVEAILSKLNIRCKHL